MQASQTVLASIFNPSAAMDRRFALPPGDGNVIAHPRDLYHLLMAYYESNGLYDDLSRNLFNVGQISPAMKSLRNPAYRIVEFYASKVWPGTLPSALPIVADRVSIVPAIEQIWKWSNWSAKKQVCVRHAATFGDTFIKVCSRPANTSAGVEARVWLDLIKPEHVTEFECDEHDAYLTYIKIDVPHNITTDREGTQIIKWHTEVWSKDDQLYRKWIHESGPDELVSKLGTPVETIAFADIGIDFIPISHAKFKDIGEARGIGSYTLSIELIDEINRKATRLSQMLWRHNKALWAILANAMDKEGKPVPPPRFAGDQVQQVGPAGFANYAAVSDQLTMDDGDILRLSGMSKIESLVPQINYEAARNIIEDDLRELEADQPEMAYYTITSMAGEVSGRALRFRLAPAIDRVVEARGNLESALINAQKMALTIGQLVGAISPSVGSFANGDFEHEFEDRPVIPTNDLEDSLARKTSAEAASAQQAAGVSKKQSLIENFGYGEEEVTRIIAEGEADSTKAIEQAQKAFNAGANEPAAPPVSQPTGGDNAAAAAG